MLITRMVDKTTYTSDILQHISVNQKLLIRFNANNGFCTNVSFESNNVKIVSIVDNPNEYVIQIDVTSARFLDVQDRSWVRLIYDTLSSQLTCVVDYHTSNGYPKVEAVL